MVQELSATEYLNQLLQDKTTVSKMPKIFLHSERLLDEEINRVRNDIFCPSNFLMSLVKPSGPVVKLTEKVYAKVKDYPKFNFVGRIIGPRGLTLRQVEQETGAKLLVRGRGSMKDKKVEEEKRGQPNYEHLEEDLHVLLMVEDTEERARLKLQKAVEEVNFLLTPPKDGEDDIKKKQLQDLAILNGTYRPPGSNDMQGNMQQQQQQSQQQPQPNNGLPNAVSPNGLLNYPNHSPLLTPNSATFPMRNTTTGSMKAHISKVRTKYNSHPYGGNPNGAHPYGGHPNAVHQGYPSESYSAYHDNSSHYAAYPTTSAYNKQQQDVASERTDDNMVLEGPEGETSHQED